ncbi:MAG: hypothetical protein LBT40_00780 [Deltaproteobacteria bacterium]|nr:hypothetical protein [Deltaproteobacteria bacterium]
MRHGDLRIAVPDAVKGIVSGVSSPVPLIPVITVIIMIPVITMIPMIP